MTDDFGAPPDAAAKTDWTTERVTPNAQAKPNGNAPVTPAFSDDHLALEFTNLHGDKLRYVHQWGKWLKWDGTRWVFESTLGAFDMARDLCRIFANACNDPEDKTKIASAKTVAAVERLAKADRKHAATSDVWDTDPWLLNTPNGVVDLKTGNMLPHDPARYMSKITSVAPGGECPRWFKFLDEVTAGDKEMQAFLKRVAGSATIGRVLDHYWVFLWGPGGNGKGVFIDNVVMVLNDYAYVAPMEMFVVTQGERHPTDLASLRAARLVTAQETEEGQQWAEAKLKMLTGGGRITARFMRQDPFEFWPQFNLWFAGQHRPSLKSVDDAHKRRANIVPFLFKAQKPDRLLSDKLKGEHGGILARMIEGALEYQRDGLNPPLSVIDATRMYMNSQDAIGRWIEDCCVTGGTNWAGAGALHDLYREWCKSNDEPVRSKKAFGTELQNRGFRPDVQNNVRVYRGIAPKRDQRMPGDGYAEP
jgi:putative DNA primase/helicase